jgi:hypothetical protein
LEKGVQELQEFKEFKEFKEDLVPNYIANNR